MSRPPQDFSQSTTAIDLAGKAIEDLEQGTGSLYYKDRQTGEWTVKQRQLDSSKQVWGLGIQLMLSLAQELIIIGKANEQPTFICMKPLTLDAARAHMPANMSPNATQSTVYDQRPNVASNIAIVQYDQHYRTTLKGLYESNAKRLLFLSRQRVHEVVATDAEWQKKGYNSPDELGLVLAIWDITIDGTTQAFDPEQCEGLVLLADYTDASIALYPDAVMRHRPFSKGEPLTTL